MKALALALLLGASMISLQADILVNGNFADGRAHWKGDAQDPDTGGDLSTNPTPQGGVVVTLKKDKWTKIYQTFTTHEKKLHYSITFILSADYQPDRHQPQSSGFAPTPGLDDIDGVPIYFAENDGSWMGIIAQTGINSSLFSLQPDLKKADAQTLSGYIQGAPDENNDMTIVFAFPPGAGSVTINKVALTSGDQ
jgi:hypothetical protein